jgi:polysaccharide pyruvyl transferase WcaK-like protein
MTERATRVALLHHISGANLGDDGTLQAVLQNIKNRWPDVEIIALSMNPEDTRKRHGINAFPIRQRTWTMGNKHVNNSVTFKQKIKILLRASPLLFQLLQRFNFIAVGLPKTLFREILFCVRAIHLVKSLDLLIVCGGGQLIESSGGPWEFVGGPWHFPFTVFKWVFAARLFRVKCFVLNVGAGPLVRPLAKWFVRRSLSLADYASFRDADSQKLVHKIGVTRQTHVVCDSAYSLQPPPANGRLNLNTQGKGTVGLAPMAYGDPRLSPKHDPAIYNQFIQQLAAFSSWLLKNGYRVTLFCTDIGIDPPAIEDLERQLRNDDSISVPIANGFLCRVHQWTASELLENMSSADYLVVCRFHAVVYAHLLNVPVLAINHHPKVMAQMGDLGLSEFCINLEDCNLDVMAERFNALVDNRDAVRLRMVQKLADYRQQLSSQFDELFPPETQRKTTDVCHLVGQLS